MEDLERRRRQGEVMRLGSCRLRASVWALALGCLTVALCGLPLAHADVVSERDGARVVASKTQGKSGRDDAGSRQRDAGKAAPSKFTFVSKEKYQQLKKQYETEVARRTAESAVKWNAYGACMEDPRRWACQPPAGTYQPGEFRYRPAGEPASRPAIGISPQQAAYIATARIRLTAPKPMIGPPPEINEWKMAAVGYPLWLWADGDLDPAPVSDSVFDLSVSLNARLQKVIFLMGDGASVTCTVLDRRWHRGVEPGTPSPVCGYRYQKPSLPRGRYTVTARSVWAIDWRINNTSGTIPLYQEASTTLPVGELQVLVR